ncbi:MAG: hypothetical protein HND42_11240 [Armatimonadetes bacterium]|nr:hypothetical protein [Armatimonadota bacterium]NOG93804.1 hypothetical protein [Armatimonadota bacterium]
MVWVAAVAVVQATTRNATLDILVEGKPVGTAVVQVTLLSQGGIRNKMRTEIGEGANRVVIEQESEYGKTAAPTRKYLRRFHKNPMMVVVTFAGSTANAVIEEGRSRQLKSVVAPPGAQIAAESEFWFFTFKPKVGAVSSYFRFDVDKLEWVKTEAKYDGEVRLEIGGKTLNAHKISSGAYTVWQDAGGMPLRIDSAGATFRRRF